ncbi:PucR family transcriptional regulator [Pyxidicoccus fallax]|uniref:PucR family transcriptional regulator n=1 Tax=Pyxidicoccus fallax TaxID=394095 RepID=A0A848L9X7_9BACT|nr:PucR family transcriptional regulator [Pyxidicoccus fallax]NMO15669.1 PucR family transcriptional regulator [Pyxidicoccus fallax]NPC78789.1 PucR family transcriptional regulator [Pyxidicoccus fallax]
MVHQRGNASWQWERPSKRVRELIRRGAERALNAPPEWLEELDAATLSTEHMRAIADDPVLAAAARRTNRANLLHWAAANIQDPGAPVPANLGPEPLAIARDLVRRGMNESALHTYRTGQNAAWLRWMSIAFELTSDPDELRELLDVTARSISAFIEATVAGISAQMDAERDELTRGTHAERREVVSLLLDGAPIQPQNASRRLGYELDQVHRAAVIWSDAAESDLGALEGAADALARAARVQRPLSVVASAATLWVWVPGGAEPDLEQVGLALQQTPSVRMAIGSTGRGVEGFRRSHLDALTTQRMVARLGSERRIVSFDDVRLVSLVTQDAEGADQFVKHTLGELESADPELRRALLTFLNEGCNASRTAERLHTHRNTLLRRLSRAEELLPRPLEHQRVQVAVALEVLRWRTHGA